MKDEKFSSEITPEANSQETSSTDNDVHGRQSVIKRRSFLGGLGMAAAATIGAGFLASETSARAQDSSTDALNRGDTAILRLLAAVELIEADLWVQYAELGGLTSGQPIEVTPQKLNAYQAALSNLDSDGPQYITSNTLDEVSHANFLNKYLESRGADPVDFDQFRTLEGSTATGSSGKRRLTNLMHLNVDTSWYVRYRSSTNPDFGVTYPQAVKIEDKTAIPITNDDFDNVAHIQAIANTAAFHFGYIEQGGTSLYAIMSQKVTSPQVLQITLGIGGDEIAHFLEWVDFAGNGVQAPIAPLTDPKTGLTFPDFFAPHNFNKLTQPSLIFPVPCEFISSDLPKVSIIRPLHDKFGGAVATIKSFTADGLFVGQSKEFLDLLNDLAADADAAERE